MYSVKLDDKLPKNLDQEWIQLILEAKKKGLTVEEVRAFLKQNVKIKTEHIT